MVEIAELLKTGITGVGVMKGLLRRFVKEKYPDAKEADTRYYPTKKVLKTEMYKARNKLRTSLIDELNVEGLVKEIQENNPGDYVYYRPCTKKSEQFSVVEDPKEDDICFHPMSSADKDLSHQLLFIHMTAAQQYILRRYRI